MRALAAVVVFASVLLLTSSVNDANAIPAFARKYRTTCATCHSPFPRLNEFGERFAANGFEFPGEQPRDTIATGDPLLRLQNTLPLAIRIDAYMAAYSRSRGAEVGADLQTPWVLKALSGGQVADKISYYLYFLLSERGEVGGLEDAYVQFTDIGGSGISAMVGQFQVSDPMFKRELRLEYEDYQPYRVRIGDIRADLTYERGIMATWSPVGGTDLAFQVVNGQGLDEANNNRQYDSDDFKNVGLHLSQDVGPMRLGAYGYFGRESAEGVKSDIRIFGPDGTIPLGKVGELNFQYLRRWDDDPFLGSCTPGTPCPGGATQPFSTTTDAAMAEVLYWPKGPGGRWYLTGLWNWIDADAEVISVRLGEQDEGSGFISRYHTASVGANYVLRRNVRLLGELGRDFERESTRFVAGFSLAF